MFIETCQGKLPTGQVVSLIFEKLELPVDNSEYLDSHIVHVSSR